MWDGKKSHHEQFQITPVTWSGKQKINEAKFRHVRLLPSRLVFEFSEELFWINRLDLCSNVLRDGDSGNESDVLWGLGGIANNRSMHDYDVHAENFDSKRRPQRLSFLKSPTLHHHHSFLYEVDATMNTWNNFSFSHKNDPIWAQRERR